MKNAAGDKDCDVYLAKELKEAGIRPIRYASPQKGEVPAKVRGILREGFLHRAWYYWIAEGPAIPMDVAMKLYEGHGSVARVAGYAGGVSPEDWYGGKGIWRSKEKWTYHIDTQEGLKAFADTIKSLPRR